jgi:hypothetical protein
MVSFWVTDIRMRKRKVSYMNFYRITNKIYICIYLMGTPLEKNKQNEENGKPAQKIYKS